MRASSQSDVNLVTSGGSNRDLSDPPSQVCPVLNPASSLNESEVHSDAESSSQVPNLQTENSVSSNKLFDLNISLGETRAFFFS